VPDNEAKSFSQVVTELWDLTRTYAKQETVDPLKNLGRFLGGGIPGAIVLGIGVVLLMLSMLRLLQTETDTAFTGSLSWVPYVIVLIGGALLIAAALFTISRRKGGL
jgi:hypothetical protein